MDLMGRLLETLSPRRFAEVAGQVHRTPWCVGRLAGAPLPSQCLQQCEGKNHTDCAMGENKGQIVTCNFQHQPVARQ